MKFVVIESPFRASDGYSQRQHVLYAQMALADCIRRGEAAFASHLLLPQALDDNNAQERALGIAMGFEIGRACDMVAVYRDLGISPGMQEAIRHWENMGKPWEYRKLSEGELKAVRDMTDD